MENCNLLLSGFNISEVHKKFGNLKLCRQIIRIKHSFFKRKFMKKFNILFCPWFFNFFIKIDLLWIFSRQNTLEFYRINAKKTGIVTRLMSETSENLNQADIRNPLRYVALHRITAPQFIRRSLHSSWYKQVPTHCLSLFAIEAGDLLDSVKSQNSAISIKCIIE